jgi:hypothetical protein
VRCPARRVLPSRRDLHPDKSIPPRRSKERSASARQLYDGSDRPDSDSLQRRRSLGRSLDSASTSSVPSVVEPSTTPRCLQSLLIRGSGASDVHVSLVARGGHGPTPAVVEAGGSALERMGESAAAVEAAGRSGAAPETTGPKRAAPETTGSKCAAPSRARRIAR